MPNVTAHAADPTMTVQSYHESEVVITVQVWSVHLLACLQATICLPLCTRSACKINGSCTMPPSTSKQNRDPYGSSANQLMFFNTQPSFKQSTLFWGGSVRVTTFEASLVCCFWLFKLHYHRFLAHSHIYNVDCENPAHFIMTVLLYWCYSPHNVYLIAAVMATSCCTICIISSNVMGVLHVRACRRHRTITRSPPRTEGLQSWVVQVTWCKL